jgi:hypothetical protein
VAPILVIGISMSGGWFFVVASEAITVGNTTVTLAMPISRYATRPVNGACTSSNAAPIRNEPAWSQPPTRQCRAA